jgi:hypothetical protein
MWNVECGYDRHEMIRARIACTALPTRPTRTQEWMLHAEIAIQTLAQLCRGVDVDRLQVTGLFMSAPDNDPGLRAVVSEASSSPEPIG